MYEHRRADKCIRDCIPSCQRRKSCAQGGTLLCSQWKIRSPARHVDGVVVKAGIRSSRRWYFKIQDTSHIRYFCDSPTENTRKRIRIALLHINGALLSATQTVPNVRAGFEKTVRSLNSLIAIATAGTAGSGAAFHRTHAVSDQVSPIITHDVRTALEVLKCV